MTSIVQYEGNLRTKATHLQSGNSILTDAPTDNEGKGENFSPTDLVATALASCMATIMGIYAKNNRLNIEQTKFEITKIMATEPRRISEIQVNVYVANGKNLDETTRKKLIHVALNCPVAKSLNTNIHQNVKFYFE
jgi:uncharacterized OsmC-like protein